MVTNRVLDATCILFHFQALQTGLNLCQVSSLETCFSPVSGLNLGTYNIIKRDRAGVVQWLRG